MKVAFRSNQLGLRGTEIQLYNYAKGNIDILKNESIIISDKNSDNRTLPKFKELCEVFLYDTFSDIETICSEQNVDVIYYIDGGNKTPRVKGVKNCKHSVFQIYEPHADVYAYVSEWLGSTMNDSLYVPHIVDNLNYTTDDYRKELNIPPESMVFGYYGGSDQFNIPTVMQAVVEVATKHPDRYFVFMNITPFWENLPNIIFLPGDHDLSIKSKFINTCDVCLHARQIGETFGLTIAEFSMRNKPTITCDTSYDQAHLHMLGEKCFTYNNYQSIYKLLSELTHSDIKDKDWNAYKDFTPEKVMKIFNNVFLKEGD